MAVAITEAMQQISTDLESLKLYTFFDVHLTTLK